MIEHYCYQCWVTRRFQWMCNEYAGGQCWELYCCEVYEVEPLDKIRENVVWDDLTCDQARVIRYVGGARGIGQRALRTFKPGQWHSNPGSEVRYKRWKHYVHKPQGRKR